MKYQRKNFQSVTASASPAFVFAEAEGVIPNTSTALSLASFETSDVSMEEYKDNNRKFFSILLGHVAFTKSDDRERRFLEIH